MNRIKSSAELSAHIDAAEMGTSHSLSDAGRKVGRIMENWPSDRGIYIQLQRLAGFIAKTREDLASLRPDEVKEEFIPKATDQLDAIVEATASATHRIMDAADVIMDLAGRIPADEASKAMAAVTSIYEACTFQDITGQRVTKIVNMLKVIEARVDKLVAAMDDIKPETAPSTAAAKAANSGNSSQQDIDSLFGEPILSPEGGLSERSELHGPALPGQGKSQKEIDALLFE